MNSMPFAAGTPSPWHMIPQHHTPVSTSLWEPGALHNNLQYLRDTLDLAKAMKKELEMLISSKEKGSLDDMEDVSLSFLSKWLKEKKISLEMQESYTLEAVNSLLSTLKCQIEPFSILTNQATSWEEKSAVARLNDKINKYKRNKLWRKRKRKRNAEMRAKEHERFDLADQEADDWRAREIAKDIARRKVEKMKEIARAKANEERKRLESELELVLIVEKLQELRSIRIQKLKKQESKLQDICDTVCFCMCKPTVSFIFACIVGLKSCGRLGNSLSSIEGHFLPEEDDKFLERVRAAVEEEERQAAASADTDAAKDAIATAEEWRKTINSDVPDIKGINVNENGDIASQVQVTESEVGRIFDATDLKSEQRGLDGPSSGGAYNSVSNLPLEFYHYYHGSNTDIGTLIEVRRTWDQYIRPGGSRIPGHWVQPPPPANEIWASYLVERKD